MARRITQIWGVWCHATGQRRPIAGERREAGDWLRHTNGDIVGLQGKRAAMDRAAHEFGFSTYSETKRKGWCEVRELGKATA